MPTAHLAFVKESNVRCRICRVEWGFNFVGNKRLTLAPGTARLVAPQNSQQQAYGQGGQSKQWIGCRSMSHHRHGTSVVCTTLLADQKPRPGKHKTCSGPRNCLFTIPYPFTLMLIGPSGGRFRRPLQRGHPLWCGLPACFVPAFVNGDKIPQAFNPGVYSGLTAPLTSSTTTLATLSGAVFGRFTTTPLPLLLVVTLWPLASK